MNRKIILGLISLSILSFFLTSAFAPQRALDVSLQSVSYKVEKGVTFKFLMSGDTIHKHDLKGSVLIHDRRLRLHCNYSGDPVPAVVVCTSDKGTAKFAGQPAVVSVAGHSFYFVVPAKVARR